MNRQQALQFKLPFGKYKGELLGRIWLDDENYVFWLYDAIDARKYSELYAAIGILVAGPQAA